MIKLIIARHGNTFNKGETPTRVGSRTDIPLVDSGKEQAKLIGEYLVKEGKVNAPCRFDVIEIRDGQINHIENAFFG